MAVGAGALGISQTSPIRAHGPHTTAGTWVVTAYVGVGGSGVTVGATAVLIASAITTSAADAVGSNAGPEETGALVVWDVEATKAGGGLNHQSPTSAVPPTNNRMTMESRKFTQNGVRCGGGVGSVGVSMRGVLDAN